MKTLSIIRGTKARGCLLALSVVLLTLSAQAQSARRPNIILILTDDQGYGDLSAHGNPILKTPNLDRLHDEAVRFTDFHVSPTCAPTRSALLSGRHEFKNGVTHTILERERLSLKTVTLAEVLKSAGYATGIFGKWHLGDEPERWPARRGFDEMFIHGCGGIGQTYPGSCGDAPGNQYFDPVINHNGKFEKTSGYCTDVFFNQASQWIERAKGRKPFFAMITPNAPHAPLVVAEKYERMYADKLPPDKAGQDTAKFFGMIANIDENVGRLLALLKEQGIERDTLVIFMNDNGGTAGVRVWNAGMRAAKNTPYLGGTRAISFWRWPGGLKPATVDALAAHIDVFPTLAELVGAKLSATVKAQVEGRSLAPLLKNPNADWPERRLFTHIGRWAKGSDPNDAKYAQCSIRSRQWHLVNSDKQGAKRWELYDVKADPGEKNDVAAAHPDVVKALDAAYDKWWAEVLPRLENENAAQPAVNPYHELYWKQYRGPGPNNVPPKTKTAAAFSPTPQRPPNIVLLLIDDYGWADSGCYGSTFHRTPNIDRLAARGMRFTDAYAATPVCSPTRAALLTGKHPARLHLTDWLPGRADRPDQKLARPRIEQQLPLSETTLAEALKQAGYATAHIGKWHLGGVGFEPERQGFELNIAGDHTGTPLSYFAPFQRDGRFMPKLEQASVGEYLPDRLTTEAEQFIEQHRDRPFFLYLAHYSVHIPMRAKPALIEKYRALAAPVGKQNNPVYAAMIESMDESVGRLMRKLEQLGLGDDTVFIFTSDNGGLSVKEGPDTPATSNAPLRDGKGYLYEGGLRVPLIIAWPKRVKAGSANRTPVYSGDLFATALDVAGLKNETGVDGLSLLPLLTGQGRFKREALYWHYPHYSNQGGKPGGAVRQGDFKLIEFYEDNHVELYNLKHDLGETRDLARQQAALARRMQQKLAAWRGAVNAQMMTPNPAYQGAGRSGGNDHASAKSKYTTLVQRRPSGAVRVLAGQAWAVTLPGQVANSQALPARTRTAPLVPIAVPRE